MDKINSLMTNISVNETEAKRVSYFMNVILLVNISFFVILALIKLALFHTLMTDYVVWALIVILSIIYFIYKKGKVYLAGILYISAIWISMTLLAWTFEGVRDIAVVAYILCIIIAMNVTRYWLSIFIGVLSAISVWSLYFAEHSKILIPEHESVFGYTFEFTIIIAISLALVYINRKSYLLFYNKISNEFNKRLETETLLRESEQKMHAVYDRSFGLIGMLSKDGILIEANRTALEFAGVTLSDIKGIPFWETPWWSHSTEVQNQIKESINKAAKGEFVRIETTHLSKGGNLHNIDFTLKPVLDDNGQVSYLIPEGHDITESKRTKQALLESEERFRTLSSITTEGIMIHRDGIIIDANQAFANMVGYNNPDDLLGKNGLDLIPFTPESKEVVLDHFIRNSDETFDIEVFSKNGTIITAETKGVEIIYNGKDSRIVYMRDITERKKFEKRERQSVLNLEQLSNFSIELINIPLEQDFFQIISERLLKFMPSDGIMSLREYDHNTDSYVLRKVAGKSFDLKSSTKTLGVNPLALDRKFSAEILKLLSTGKLNKLFADTISLNKDLPQSVKKMLNEFLVSSNNYIMGFVTGEKILGTLSIVIPREIEIPDLKIIETFGNQIAILLEKRRAEEALKAALERSQKEQAVVANIAALQRTPGIKMGEYYKQITSIAAKAIGVERVSVWMFNDNQTDLKCESLYEASPDRHSSGDTLPLSGLKNEFEAFRGAKYIETNDPLTNPRTAAYVEGYLKPLHITSMLDAVIIGSTRNLGLLSFEHVDKKHKWESDEIAFICQLADQIALKILDNKRRLAEIELQYQSRLQELLMNISSKYINLPLDKFESSINESMREMVEFVDADRCYLFEYDFQKEIGNATHEWYREGLLPILNEFHMMSLATAEGWDFKKHQEGKTIWIPDILALPPSWFSENQKTHSVKSKLAVPLMNSGECIGFVGFDWLRKPHFYSGIEHQLLLFFANLLVSIQQRRQAGDALQKSEEKFRQLVENMNDVFFMLDTEGIVTYLSPSARQLLKYDSSSLIGHSFSEIIYPDDLDKLNLEFQVNMKNRPSLREFRYYNSDQQICWAQTSSIPIISDGKVIGIRGIFSDITRRKADEEALRKLSIAVEQSPASIVITNLLGKIEYVNPSFTHMTGYSAEESLGKNPRILKSGHTKMEEYTELWSNISSGLEWRGEFYNRKKNGDFFWESAIISPIFNEKREITHYIAVKEDITEKKEATRRIFDTITETEERERQRYSHELHDGLGPILSTINLYFQMLREDTETDQKNVIISRVESCINEAISSIKEISYNLSPSVLSNFGIVSGINNFVNRLNETDKLNIDFESNIERRFEKNIEISIYRVITELINNTIKYADASKVMVKFNFIEKDSSIRLDYADNGCGFDFENAISIRKGLGLSNIYQRINTLNGKVEVESSPGKGIKVSIVLPILNNPG